MDNIPQDLRVDPLIESGSSIIRTVTVYYNIKITI